MPSFFASGGLNTFPPTPPHTNVAPRLETDPSFYASAGASATTGGHAGFAFGRYGAGAEYEKYQPTYPNPYHGRGDLNHKNSSGKQQLMAQQMLYNNPLTHGHSHGHGHGLGLGLGHGHHGLMAMHGSKLAPMDSAVPPQYRRHDPMIHQDQHHIQQHLQHQHQQRKQQHQQPQQHHQQQHQQQQQQQAKEQKTTGGVAAHLDYDMDQMTDFVAEMAHGMYALYQSKLVLADIDMLRSVHPGTTPPSQFRKYVSQILSSTRLPSSTILLGLYYLASRMRMLSSADVYPTAVKASSSSSSTPATTQVYRMLTTGLLLGSKFLDDNTFQNRSWAEVSSIPVADLNSMELEWLFGFEWKIHERIHTKSDGFMSWKAHWDSWRAKADARAAAAAAVAASSNESRAKLSPIDTNIIHRRHPLYHHGSGHHSALPKAMLSPDGPIPPQYQRSACPWLPASNASTAATTPLAASDYSPPSAPHTGPSTPDYFHSAGGSGSNAAWPYNAPPPYCATWLPQQQQQQQTSRSGPTALPLPLPRSQPPSYVHTPMYANAFSPINNNINGNVWTGHGPGCGCLYCAKSHDLYFPVSSFGMQPVAG
ncbi:meiotically up-regulated 80 protein [Trichophyton equinum CBS 127.97]|uniref:Meiotically up-regulated 80 protein n=1 Tax=Trichophyton equinum (strain ATCC MYA-4606 / CBS 127.97) TaxID=559882 RepID=F2PW74_TRIEC|nr:meiotically up-regulated 80 protein [Trichophyton equinum CBS 127.97]